MTGATLNNDTIIIDILDNDISIALEKLTSLLDKGNNDDVPNKYSKKLSNNTTDISKPIITSAIETIGGKRKCPHIDAIYCHISKSEAANKTRFVNNTATTQIQNNLQTLMPMNSLLSINLCLLMMKSNPYILPSLHLLKK